MVRIPVSSEMLLMNRKNLVVDEVALFEKALAFWKLMLPVDPAPDVGFRKTCLRNKGCRSDFLVDGPFSGVDSGQLGDALDELRQPASR
uniref:Uncharacterized protein n=1 Tax=Fagus sylvatica TaxID=28930 RepID=A0A2N9FM46_FAGSY